MVFNSKLGDHYDDHYDDHYMRQQSPVFVHILPKLSFIFFIKLSNNFLSVK